MDDDLKETRLRLVAENLLKHRYPQAGDNPKLTTGAVPVSAATREAEEFLVLFDAAMAFVADKPHG